MPAKTKVQDIMVKNLFTVTLDDTVHDVDEIMRTEDVRHVPVIDSGKLVGLVTERRVKEYILRQIYEFDDGYNGATHNKISDYRDLLEKNVRVIYPEDSVQKAIELMAKYKTDCLPVVDWEHNLVGILSSVDIMLFMNKALNDGLEI